MSEVMMAPDGQTDWPRFRFHLLGLAHLPTQREVSPCAYTQKVIKLAHMLKNLGHTVYFYGGEGSEVTCDEFIPVVSDAERRACYGEYDWRSTFFRHDPLDAAHQAFNRRAIAAIQARQQPGDFLLCTMGNYQKPIADALPDLWAVEPGIGYEGVFAPYRAFESYAWMHFVYGLMGQRDGSWYDAVIPNYFDPADFPFKAEKGDYALFIGRLVNRKGVDVAVQVTRALGIPLLIAGQGSLHNEEEGLAIDEPHVTHLGAVGPAQRAVLMGGARMAFAPTYYIEPFGGVAVEAQLCGTPVLTTDWGAYSETVLHGVTGYRCRTFDDFLWAADNVARLTPADCRAWAEENYALERVQWMFQEYFCKIADLGRGGWYERHPQRSDLDWLRKRYPARATQAAGASMEKAYELRTA
jgi:glycosyltransferase involved in cell wall biosynthesis